MEEHIRVSCIKEPEDGNFTVGKVYEAGIQDYHWTGKLIYDAKDDSGKYVVIGAIKSKKFAASFKKIGVLEHKVLMVEGMFRLPDDFEGSIADALMLVAKDRKKEESKVQVLF